MLPCIIYAIQGSSVQGNSNRQIAVNKILITPFLLHFLVPYVELWKNSNVVMWASNFGSISEQSSVKCETRPYCDSSCVDINLDGCGFEAVMRNSRFECENHSEVEVALDECRGPRGPLRLPPNPLRSSPFWQFYNSCQESGVSFFVLLFWLRIRI